MKPKSIIFAFVFFFNLIPTILKAQDNPYGDCVTKAYNDCNAACNQALEDKFFGQIDCISTAVGQGVLDLSNIGINGAADVGEALEMVYDPSNWDNIDGAVDDLAGLPKSFTDCMSGQEATYQQGLADAGKQFDADMTGTADSSNGGGCASIPH